MKLQIVSFEQAKMLKELGFPQKIESYNYLCISGFSIDGKETSMISSVNNLEYIAPPLELVAKWLRDEKKLPIIIDVVSTNNIVTKYWWKIFNGAKGLIPMSEPIYKTYEEALSAGIDKAIEILKNSSK